MKSSKYSKGFERDFSFYLRMRNIFAFDGHIERDIIFDKNGVDGKKAFFIYDSQGKIKPTKHPNLLRTLIRTKGSANLHIKMYAEDRAKGLLPLIEFRGMCIMWNVPEWFYYAVEGQKIKNYNNIGLPNYFMQQAAAQKQRHKEGLRS